MRSWMCVLASWMVAPAIAPAQPKLDVEAIDRKIRQWQPAKEERRFDDIGWAADIRTALKLGRAHQRPVFLFTHDGRMNIGRC